MLGYSPIGAAPLASAVLAPDLEHKYAYLECSEAQDAAQVVLFFPALIVSASDAPDVAGITFAVTASTSFAITEAQDVVSAPVISTTVASANITEAADVSAIYILPIAEASLASTEAKDTASFAAKVNIMTLAAIDAADTASLSTAITGSVAVTAIEAADGYNITLYGQWGELITPTATTWQLVA